MSHRIRVSILDDHQSILDGYRYRLSKAERVEVVATASFGEALEPMLAEHPTDVLLLDLQVPTSQANHNPYPIPQMIPRLLQAYPTLCILIISMHAKRPLIKSVMEAGASGYILKDDGETIQRLEEIIVAVADGDIYLSQAADELYDPGEGSVLTPRQLEVLSLFAAYPNHTSASVALQLEVAHSTVRNLLSEAYMRLGVRNRSAAILKAQELGVIPMATIAYEAQHSD